jgi:hypothetical protein
MDINELMELRASHNAPFNHQEYTVWLHNKIVEKINHELWEFIELKSTYAACNHIMSLPSLQEIK